jgi:hypothetical protein
MKGSFSNSLGSVIAGSEVKFVFRRVEGAGVSACSVVDSDGDGLTDEEKEIFKAIEESEKSLRDSESEILDIETRRKTFIF